MFSIGQFARLSAVSVRTLRHYDEIGVLRPASVDPDTGYRGYTADQLGQLNRIVALKELGLSLAQARRLLDGITLDELQGMLLLRRAQLEQEIEQHRSQLLGVEARLRFIAREGSMPADDIIAKKIPAIGVVAISEYVATLGPATVVPAVNRCAEQFDQLGIRDMIKETGPYMFFYDDDGESGGTMHLALPVAEPPGELPAPATYVELPAIEAAVTVRSGAAASIFPVVYHDLVRWITEHGFQPRFPGREIWVHEVDDIERVSEQVFEVQLPFTRPDAAPAARP